MGRKRDVQKGVVSLNHDDGGGEGSRSNPPGDTPNQMRVEALPEKSNPSLTLRVRLAGRNRLPIHRERGKLSVEKRFKKAGKEDHGEVIIVYKNNGSKCELM